MSRLVVVGGYGHVGSQLAFHASRRTRWSEVVVGGRRPDAAARVAADLGVRAAGHPIDFRTGEGLSRVVEAGDLVVNAAGDDREAALLRRSMSLGCHYADLTADRHALAAMRSLHGDARDAGIRALVGVGLAPGATNLLARAAVEALGGADEVDLGLVLSLSDGFGQAAIDWTLHTVAFDRDAFTDSTVLPFDTLGRRRVHAFGFPEQHFLPATLGLGQARSWFGLHPAPLGGALAWLLRPDATRAVLRNATLRRAVSRLAARSPHHRGAPVAASAVARRGERTAHVTLTAASESGTTAVCAAAILGCWEGERPGVWFPEEAVRPRAFFDDVAAAVRIAGSAVGPGPGRPATRQ